MHEEMKRFHPYPISDSHEHVECREPITETEKTFARVFDYFGYERIILLSIQDLLEKPLDPGCDMKILYLKDKFFPRVYAFSGLRHHYDERDTAEWYYTQVKDAWETGFDGVKLFELKPGMRKKTGKALDDDIYDKMFSYLEENNIPITIHAGDPATFWDASGDDLAMRIERGWVYDESYPSRHSIFAEIDGVMRRHPKLRLTVAHLMCDNEDVACATKFIADYPNTGYDLTACPSEYTIASEKPDEWREFFLRFADRLYFGTDLYNRGITDSSVDNWGRTSCLLSRMYLEGKDPFSFDGKNYRPLNLPEDVIQKIYFENLVSRVGSVPRAIDGEKAVRLCGKLEQALKSELFGPEVAAYKAEDLDNIRKITKAFLKHTDITGKDVLV